MITLFLDIVTTAAILFIVAAGLLIVFGVMKIVNFAHASFVTVGAYAALVASRLGLPPVLAPLVAFVVGGLIGAATERIVVRRLYRRPLDAILATWGLGIVLGQLVTLAFGREVQFVPAPISGTLALFGADYSLYRLLLVPVAFVIAALFAGLLNGTRLGLSTRAVIMNETLAQGLGIDSSRVRLITFGIGCGLAAVAGTLITPLASVDPNMGLAWLIGAFMLVMVSGGSLLTLGLSCFVLGGLQVLASTFISPILGGLTIALLAAVALRLPGGVAAQRRHHPRLSLGHADRAVDHLAGRRAARRRIGAADGAKLVRLHRGVSAQRRRARLAVARRDQRDRRFPHRPARPARRRDARRGPRRAGGDHHGADLRRVDSRPRATRVPGRLAVAAVAVGRGAARLQIAAAGRRRLYRAFEADPSAVVRATAVRRPT